MWAPRASTCPGTALHLHQPVDHLLRNAADDLLPAKRVEGHDRQPEGGVAADERFLLQHGDGGACACRRDGCADPRRASPGNQNLAVSERTHSFLPPSTLLINPSALRPEGRSIPSTRAQAEGLSERAFVPALESRAWRSRGVNRLPKPWTRVRPCPIINYHVKIFDY